jgi:hypothetical protein
LERREKTESRSQSIARPKIVLMVASDPRAKDRVMREPFISVEGVR